MSSRQLRKLQKQRELEQLQAVSPANHEDHDSDESEDAAPIRTSKPKPSVFSAFAALGDQDMDDEEEEEEQHDNDNDKDIPTETPAHTENPSKKSKKKKNKKKKTPHHSINKTQESTRTDAGADDVDNRIDEVMREIRLASLKTDNENQKALRIQAYERVCHLLRINNYHLKVLNEMRNLFGREAIVAAGNEENEERARNLHSRHMPQQQDLETFLKRRSGKPLPEVTLRRNPFLPGKDTWPYGSTDGLSMIQMQINEAEEPMPGRVEFRFAHNAIYNELEQGFFRLVQSHDPMRLVYYLHDHPYHVSSLIQVSKVAKQDQNLALSADLCERALFACGRVTLSAFRQKMEEGKARLDFNRPENRQFWLAGYHYLKSLIMKGTYRTALEWAKLLFSMDWSDPYGMIHFIHPLAIRAHESKWFIDFCDSEVMDKFDTVQDYIRQTLVLARLQQKDTAGAKALLLEGMERLPWLYSSIFKALGLDIPKALWGMLARDSHEALFVELYIHQTKSLWDNAQTITLLKQAAGQSTMPDSLKFGPPPVVGRNVARFIYLDNTPSLMGLVPEDLLSTSPNWEFDPIPPPREENIFSYNSQQQPWVQAESPELPGLEIPTDLEGLRRLRNLIRQGNGPQDLPPEFERFIEEAIGLVQAEGEGGLNETPDDVVDDTGRGAEEEIPGARARQAQEYQENERGIAQGLIHALRDMFRGVVPEESPDDSGLDDNNSNRMPGAWDSDTDDDPMPDLLDGDID